MATQEGPRAQECSDSTSRRLDTARRRLDIARASAVQRRATGGQPGGTRRTHGRRQRPDNVGGLLLEPEPVCTGRLQRRRPHSRGGSTMEPKSGQPKVPHRPGSSRARRPPRRTWGRTGVVAVSPQGKGGRRKRAPSPRSSGGWMVRRSHPGCGGTRMVSASASTRWGYQEPAARKGAAYALLQWGMPLLPWQNAQRTPPGAAPMKVQRGVVRAAQWEQYNPTHRRVGGDSLAVP